MMMMLIIIITTLLISTLLCIQIQKAVILNTWYNQKVFGRTVNNKCLVSEASTYKDQQNCEVRNLDDDDDDDDDDNYIIIIIIVITF
jgi:hypothetical protein